MPKGIKAASSGEQMQPAEGVSADKTALVPDTIEVTSANTFEDVLRYDQAGVRILFACEKGKFLALESEQIEQLSRFTRMVYQAMKAQNASMEAEDPDFAEIKRRLTVDQISGSANDKLKIRGNAEGFDSKFETYWFRPDNIGKAKNNGWVPVSSRETSTLLPNDGHVAIRDNGKEELIAFKRPREMRAQIAAERASMEKKQDQAEAASYDQSIRKQGSRPLGSSELASGGFKDIE